MAASPAVFSPRLHEVQRALARALPGGHVPASSAVLETLPPADPPLIERARMIEDAQPMPHAVQAAPAVRFAAFLDGTQRSEVAFYGAAGMPLVLGVVAAVVRRRVEGRATTWRHAVWSRMYAPRAAMTDAEWVALAGLGIDVIDTSHDAPELADAHPFAIRDGALRQAQRDREQLEQRLAQQWCAETGELLYVDGGIRGSDTLARAPQLVGVVKSHRTLYADAAGRAVIFALREGERSSAFVIESRTKVPVLSWYLRLRGSPGQDPLWGLVRVETRLVPDAAPRDVARHADAVSACILAERAPTGHPDPRWDTMVYGIRDCEAFLKVIA